MLKSAFLCSHVLGESVDDYGGGYSESIAEMCEELQNGSLPILIQTPNGREDTGTSQDCFILNSSATSKLHMKMFEFLGENFMQEFFLYLNNIIIEYVWCLMCI